MSHPIAQRDRAYPSRLNSADVATISELIRAGWSQGQSVLDTFARTWDSGRYLASPRTWYRIANRIDQSTRPASPRLRTRSPRQVPVVAATAPGQVWMWDITDLNGTYVGQRYKAYSIQDLYSRKIIASCVAPREDEDITAGLFAAAFDTDQVPRVIHSDNGSVMRSARLAQLCAAMNVTMSYSRPRVSNDNPYKESEFRTMKHRPSYPTTFDDIHSARDWVESYVDWFNREHHHRGLALFTPQSVHDGNWRRHHSVRTSTLNTYYAHNPDRFRHRRPSVHRPRSRVGINLHHEHNQIALNTN
ncbi:MULTISPECIES: DDE-type integrase/transposase/recombinase [unclassified Gordonia (in: high G+C Gram-positive bacteria)]|uniref:DDE-type integrase/transposase/recombinase n=1 Tax=unclassified Gordonia (in: high G+C Gram-positive bacteria) TaxID=2657482 RepID=UPI000AE72E7B|nr:MULTISPECIES: DDE-type integrase/transposase/recombinase [unclassified Gordonia (in: high G+C Gram-positive bacteria)]